MAHTVEHWIRQARAQVPGAVISPNQVGNQIQYRVLGHPEIQPISRPIGQLPNVPTQATTTMQPSQATEAQQEAAQALSLSPMALIAAVLVGGAL